MKKINLLLKSSLLVLLSSNAFAVTGEACHEDVPSQIGYRPSLFECNGNAAILLRGSYRNAYSVVVRRNGQFNDRDPNNTSCATNQCSPYKVQKKIELPEYQVNCLGGSGFSDQYQDVRRISIKFRADVTNGKDETQFNQWCLHDKKSNLN